jgi:hypothetical protein
VFGRVLRVADGLMGFVVECGFLVGKFLGGLVLDLISRKSFPHVKSTKGLSCHAATATPHQTFSGRASSRTVRVIPFNSLPQSFHPVGKGRNLGWACFPINALSRQKTTRPGSSFAVLAVEDLLQPHRISA